MIILHTSKNPIRLHGKAVSIRNSHCHECVSVELADYNTVRQGKHSKFVKTLIIECEGACNETQANCELLVQELAKNYEAVIVVGGSNHNMVTATFRKADQVVWYDNSLVG